MKVVMFYHSLLSDWNHGNAHFLRGIATELMMRGHSVNVYEQQNAWSLKNLIERHGFIQINNFKRAYPHLTSNIYSPGSLHLEKIVDGANLVIVHEWNDPELVRALGRLRSHSNNFKLLFHDTHHRSVSRPEEMAAYDLKHYDGALVFGDAIRSIYLSRGWAHRVWTWHEAADIRLFFPRTAVEQKGDIVWIGNWGDEERTAELQEFLFDPATRLKFKASLYGVRYPDAAIHMLTDQGIDYRGWIANYRVPDVFSAFRVTVHIPRRPYARLLPGIPTIRPFEALACKIPLICSPWEDSENLFTPGKDFLVARDGTEMQKHLQSLLHDQDLVRQLTEHGYQTIRSRHTCAHRVQELFSICAELGMEREIING